MFDSIVLDSRHKFVYCLEEEKKGIFNLFSKYGAKMDSDMPILVYVDDAGLPTIDNKLALAWNRIQSFHTNYYSFLLFSTILTTLMEQVEHDTLNERLKGTFRLCSYGIGDKISDVVILRDKLLKNKEDYKKAYIKYMETGNLDLLDQLEFFIIIINPLVESLKKDIGLKQNFILLLDLGSNLSIYNKMSVNDYIGSKSNDYLSICVLCGENDWGYYYTNHGQVIQDTYDYVEIFDKKNYERRRSIHETKKGY